MKVYVVVTSHQVDGGHVAVEGVFSSAERAEEWFRPDEGWGRLLPDAGHQFGRDVYSETPLDPVDYHEDDCESGDVIERELDV